MRELLSGPQCSYKPAPKTPQFCCGCFLREWASHPWYFLVELRVSPVILELPKRPLDNPPSLSPPSSRLLRQSAKFSPFIPVRLALRFRVSCAVRRSRRRSPRAVRRSPCAVRCSSHPELSHAPTVYAQTTLRENFGTRHVKLQGATPCGVARAGPLS